MNKTGRGKKPKGTARMEEEQFEGVSCGVEREEQAGSATHEVEREEQAGGAPYEREREEQRDNQPGGTAAMREQPSDHPGSASRKGRRIASASFWVIAAIHIIVFTAIGLFTPRGWRLLLMFLGGLAVIMLLRLIISHVIRRNNINKHK